MAACTTIVYFFPAAVSCTSFPRPIFDSSPTNRIGDPLRHVTNAQRAGVFTNGCVFPRHTSRAEELQMLAALPGCCGEGVITPLDLFPRFPQNRCIARMALPGTENAVAHGQGVPASSATALEKSSRLTAGPRKSPAYGHCGWPELCVCNRGSTRVMRSSDSCLTRDSLIRAPMLTFAKEDMSSNAAIDRSAP
ncbi:hypothetical protein IWX90DRAFT_132962 [Phyllosticta citrichinensis]|uniref:Secreted protein n=1 Tax=Phyllosticta citrichinensis TaxID=1130410 RepID=A0ABR1Y510_9PEZI